MPNPKTVPESFQTPVHFRETDPAIL